MQAQLNAHSLNILVGTGPPRITHPRRPNPSRSSAGASALEAGDQRHDETRLSLHHNLLTPKPSTQAQAPGHPLMRLNLKRFMRDALAVDGNVALRTERGEAVGGAAVVPCVGVVEDLARGGAVHALL